MLCAENGADNNFIVNSQPETGTLPNIQWQDINGKTHHLKDSNGQARLLHFWAAWCFPCRKELPDMLQWKDRNTEILLIPLSLDQRMAQSSYFIKKYKLNMSPLLVDQSSRDVLKIPALPYTLLVDKDGTTIGHYHGIAPWNNNDFTMEMRSKFNINRINPVSIY